MVDRKGSSLQDLPGNPQEASQNCSEAWPVSNGSCHSVLQSPMFSTVLGKHRPPLLLADPMNSFLAPGRLEIQLPQNPGPSWSSTWGLAYLTITPFQPSTFVDILNSGGPSSRAEAPQRAAVLRLNTSFYLLVICVVSTHHRWVILPANK